MNNNTFKILTLSFLMSIIIFQVVLIVEAKNHKMEMRQSYQGGQSFEYIIKHQCQHKNGELL